MYRLKEIVIQIITIVILLTVCRFLFVYFNPEYLSDNQFKDVIYIFLHGLRFDVSTISFLLSPYVFFALVPYPKQYEIKILPLLLKIYYLTILTIALAINCFDFEYIKFTNKRLTKEIFHIQNDVLNQSIQLAFNYKHVIFIIFLLSVILFFTYRPLVKSKTTFKIKSVNFIVMLFLVVVGMRGGFQYKPLKPIHALNFMDENSSLVALNSAFSFMQSLKKSSLTRYHFYPTDAEALKVIEEFTLNETPIQIKKTNVVILIMESFATEFTGLEDSICYTPFLKQLANKGAFFNEFSANGLRSIDMTAPVFMGIPNLLDDAFNNSNYSNNNFIGLPKILESQNYTSCFFHGGKNGTMNFDVFSKKAGFQYYIGMNEYPNKNDFDGNWGIYDDKFLLWTAKKINQIQQPFFVSYFSLSSHNPYSIPKSLENKFPKGTLPIHESIGYADYSLQLFFEHIQQYEWYSNTLFIITSDHSTSCEKDKYKSIIGRYDIPLVLYHPEINLKKYEHNNVCQQKDIPQTIIDFLAIPKKISHFSTNILNRNSNYGITYGNKIYRIFDNKHVVSFNGNEFKYFKRNDYLEKNPLKRSKSHIKLEQLLKAVIQVYNNQMLNDKLTI